MKLSNERIKELISDYNVEIIEAESYEATKKQDCEDTITALNRLLELESNPNVVIFPDDPEIKYFCGLEKELVIGTDGCDDQENYMECKACLYGIHIDDIFVALKEGEQDG